MNGISDILNTGHPQWNDWKWQMGQKVICSNPANLKEAGLLTDTEQVEKTSLTPYNVNLLSELKEKNPEGFQAEWLQSFARPTKTKKHQWAWAKRHDLPSSKLSRFLPRFLRTLFWGRGSDTEVKCLENIYPETDVVVVSAVCARRCAYCFREIGNPEGEASRITGGMGAIREAIQKIIERNTPHVLVTGGDPLTRSNGQLRQILEPLVASGSVEVVRLATKMITDLPMRFYDKELLDLLTSFVQRMKEKGGSLRIVTQINHPCELTPEALQAIRNIQSCDVEILNQTTILKGINDNVKTLRELFMALDRLGIRPYKMFHAMPVIGKEYLRVPLRKFRKLVAGLHQWIPGTAVPQADLVTLVGKIPVRPAGRFAIAVPFTRRVLVRSFRGEWYLFRDAMDWVRRLREVAMAVVVVAIISTITLWPHQPQDSNCSVGEIKKVAVLANELDYPEAWARQRFEPYIQEGTLYVPVNMRM